MEAQRMQADPLDRTDIYNKQMKQLADLRKIYQDTAMASGDWHVQTVKTTSASQRLTEQIQKQKISMTQAAKEYVNFRKTQKGALAEAIREQTALRHAMTAQMTAQPFGKNEVDLITPKQITPELERARVKYGMINQMIQAAAQNTVNWGKNTQWAGRQITVGMTMPLGMAAAAGAALAFQIDKELTNIARVYDTVATDAAGQEAELANVRDTSLRSAIDMTKEYGTAAKDVLGIQSQLAATGLNGGALQQYTKETMRVATLGDFDPTVAAEMTISLSTAFRDQIKTVGDLTETYDFYNIVAQETSLQMEDIAAAIPRAASAMSALGVTTKEMGVLMVALRESGVDPAIGANALKSATATLLTPTTAAIEYWDQALNKDLNAIVEEAGGNLFKFLQTVGEELHGLDPQVVQTAVAKTFGKYQFDRATALITNFGDAMTGTANQTKTAMDLIDTSASDLAEKSGEELDRLQQSVSFKFKAAFEGVKNSLIPLGEATLSVLTPILNFVTKLIDGFSSLNPVVKNFMIALAVGGAIVGPFLMLIGIFANLMGNVVKLGTHMRNLRLRFKAQTAEEAAANIMAKDATSAFDTQARSAALLTQKIDALTQAFKENSVAQGLMMGDDGTLISKNADGRSYRRQVVKDDYGNYKYATGSRDKDGNDLSKLGSLGPRHPDVLQFQAAQGPAEKIADASVKTQKNYDKIGRTIGGISSVGLLAFTAMAGTSDMINSTWLNIAMVAGSTFMMFPGMLGGIATGFGKILTKVKALGPALKGTTGGISGSLRMMANSFTGVGPAGPLSTLKMVAPTFTKIAGAALRVFGPVGILAGGAWIIGNMIRDMQRLEQIQRDMAGSAKDWADAVGYTFAPGELPGAPKSEDDKRADDRADIADKISAANKGLADSLAEVGRTAKDSGGSLADWGQAYDMAMWEALKAVTSGASPEQARQVLEASLEIAGANPFTIDRLSLKFDRIDLEDPTAVRQAIMDAINDNEITIKPGEVLVTDTDGIWDGLKGSIRDAFGGDLSDEGRASGMRIGESLYTGIQAAGSDNRMKADIFDLYTEQINESMDTLFKKVQNSATQPGMKKALEDLGIETADQLAAAIDRIKKAQEAGEELTDSERIVINPTAIKQFQDTYSELLDTIAQGWGDARGWDSDQIDRFRDSLVSLGGLRFDQGIKESYNEIEFAERKYEEAFKRSGNTWNDETKLVVLNSWRASAGLEKATTWAQGFGAAGTTASGGIWDLANATAAAANEVSGLINFNADNIGELVDSRKQALQGAWKDVLDEAQYQYDQQRQAVIENLQAQQKATDEGYEAEEKAQSAHFEKLEKDADAYWEGRTESAEAYWDGQEEAAKAAAEAEDAAFESRIKNLQDSIEAEREAEEQRQRIFEAEQQRIDRMAQRLNSNIDFNVALNSGDLDQAARISNEVSSREQTWSNEDARASLADASEQRIKDMEDQIKGLELQREERKKWHDERLDQIGEARDAAMKALKDEEEAQRENLRITRQLAEEGLNARREASRKSMEAHIKAEQDKTETDRRELAQRLRVLQEFIPQNEQELRDHVGEVDVIYRDYGAVLNMRGSEWGKIIGQALDDNVDIAAANMQTSINWKGIAENIAAQIGDGLGMTMDQVTEFLRTGKLPEGPQQAPPLVGPTVGGFNMQKLRGVTSSIGNTFKGIWHGGGDVGGPSWSQSDRVGVPRSASPYPSEVPALLKHGEYVVKATQARKNRATLEAINNGANTQDIGGPVGAIAGYMTGLTTLHAMTAARVAQIAATSKLTNAIAERDAMLALMAAGAGGSTGTIAGGNAPWERLWNTIRGRFPQAGLNSAYNDRKGDPGFHGRGMAVDLGLRGTPGGNGNMFIAEMNRWIYDNFRGSTELIYNGLGDDRPNLKNGRDFAYNAATQAQHRNHVHWAMTPEAIAAAGQKIASGGLSALAGGGDSVRGQVLAAAAQRGWNTGANWAAIDWVIGKESSWNPNAQNPRSTASGLFQHIDGTWNAYKRPGVTAAKMRLAPVNEQAWAGMNYFAGRYGSPANARAFWERNRWYDAGGYLQPGATMAMNGTRKPEPVFTGPQWDILKANIGNATFDVPGSGRVMPVKVVDTNVATGEQNVYDITIDLRGAYIKEDLDIQDAVERAIDAREARNGRRRVIGG